jgi:hypothetical protein
MSFAPLGRGLSGSFFARTELRRRQKECPQIAQMPQMNIAVCEIGEIGGQLSRA